MEEWLTAYPDDIVDIIAYARQLAGEDIDETSAATRLMVSKDIARFQKQFSSEVAITYDGGIAVYRAVVIPEADLAVLEERGLGESWSFSRAGAHPYDRPRTGMEVIIAGEVVEDDINWPMVVGMWSSGEGEARLKNDAVVRILSISTKQGSPLREDLVGTLLGAGPSAGRRP